METTDNSAENEMTSLPLSERSKRNGIQWMMADGCGTDAEARELEDKMNQYFEENVIRQEILQECFDEIENIGMAADALDIEANNTYSTGTALRCLGAVARIADRYGISLKSKHIKEQNG